MVNKLISVHRIIAKIYSDLGLTESNVPITDMIEWAAEAIEKIGAFRFYNIKITGKDGLPLMPVTGYQAQLPLDCHSVIQVAYAQDKNSNIFYPMNYATGSFSSRAQLTSEIPNDFANSTNLGNVSGTDDLIRLTMDLYDITYDEALLKLNNDGDLKSLLTNLLGGNNKDVTTDSGETMNPLQLEYMIVPGYIKTNFKTGYLMIAYRAIPTDKNGYPMIPDDPSFVEALYWYINMKLKYIEWANGRLRDAIYYHAESKWQFYVKQAYNKSLSISSLDEMETISNAWNRLIPYVNANKTFYKNLSQKENIKIH